MCGSRSCSNAVRLGRSISAKIADDKPRRPLSRQQERPLRIEKASAQANDGIRRRSRGDLSNHGAVLVQRPPRNDRRLERCWKDGSERHLQRRSRSHLNAVRLGRSIRTKPADDKPRRPLSRQQERPLRIEKASAQANDGIRRRSRGDLSNHGAVLVQHPPRNIAGRKNGSERRLQCGA